MLHKHLINPQSQTKDEFSVFKKGKARLADY